MISLAFAQVAPTPIIGRLTINGVQPDGFHIEIKNLDNPEANIITPSDLSS